MRPTRLLAINLFIALFIAPCGAFDAKTASAQVRNQADELFLLAPRALTRLLREGEIALAEGRYTDAVNSLGTILAGGSESLPEDLRGQDFFTEVGSRGLYQTSVKSEASRLLSDLPEEGRRVLEIQYGVTARQQLDAAILEKDFDRILDVARKYVHTEAGYDAQVLLAQAEFTEGYPLAAAGILQKLLSYPAARKRFGVALAVSTARAWIQAGSDDLARSTMTKASQDFASSSVTIDGRQIELGQRVDWVKVLSQSAEMLIDSNRLAESWVVAGGSVERNATAEAGLPLATARWIKNIHSSVPERDLLQEVHEKELKAGNVILPKIELRAVDNQILTKTTDAAVIGIDFETGNTRWARYFGSSPAPLKSFSMSGGYGNNESISQELGNRVWGSSAFGRFSSDAERFYYISTDGEQPIDETAMFSGQGARDTYNYLEGVSIEAEGAILWRVGGQTGDDEPLLAGSFFLGPPLPYEGSLYAIVESNGETKLVVLDPISGELEWSQQLVSAAFQPIGFDKQRRSLAISPTISNGVVLCPTGVGAIVGVDLLSRSLRWGATYRTSSRNGSSGMFGRVRGGMAFGQADYQPLERRWEDSAMIAQDGVVLISPPDSEVMFCRDILTGIEILSPQRRGYGRYIAGLFDGNVLIVSERGVSALSINTKRLIWDTEFPSGATLAGRGLRQKDSLLVPLTGNVVVQINLETGAIEGQAVVDQPLGNLFAYKKQLLSVNATSVAAFYTREALEQDVQLALEQNAEDTWALNQKSQLAKASGDLPAAMDLLLQSYKIQPESADTKYLLVETLLDALTQDFESYISIANELDNAIEYGPQRFRFLQQIALGQIRAGNKIAAFERLLELMNDRIELTYAGAPTRTNGVRLSDRHSVDSDTWIATSLSRTFETASPEDQAIMAERIAAELATVSGTVAPLRDQRFRFLKWLPSAGNRLLMLAEDLLDGGEQTLAEQILQPSLNSADQELRSSAAEMLSRVPDGDLLIAGLSPRGGRFAAEQIINGFEIPLDPGQVISSKVGKEPAEILAEFNAIAWHRGMAIESVRDQGLFPFGRQVELTGERYGRPMPIISLSESLLDIKNQQGESIGRLDFARASSDGANSYSRAFIRGGLLLLETQSEVLAFDLYSGLTNRTESLLWRHSLIGAAPNERFSLPNMSSPNAALGITLRKRVLPGDQQAVVGPLTPAALIVQDGTNVLGLDPLTGRQVWERGGYSNDLRFASDGLEVAVVNPAEGKLEIIDCRDGTVLRQREYRGDWRHWFSHQSMMVDFRKEQDGTNINLRVWNAFSGEVLKDLSLPFSARVDRCDGRYVVVADPTGKLHYLDLEESRYNELDAKIDRDLAGISVERFQDRLVVLSNSNRIGQRPVGRTSMERFVNGKVFAIRTEDGELEWEQAGSIREMVFPVSQPRSSPFMAAYRFSNSSNSGGAGTASFLLIDLRDGHVVSLASSVVVRAKVFGMRLRPESQMIQLALGDKNFVLTMTEEARAPQPVFHFDQRSVADDVGLDLLED